MDKLYLITLPWPPNAIRPNARPHWAQRSRAVKAYRTEAFAEARRGAGIPADPNARLRVYFYPPDRIRRDVHAWTCTMKPAIDGIADAMRVDDQHFRVNYPTQFEEPVKGGCVLIEVTVEIQMADPDAPEPAHQPARRRAN